MKLGQWIIQGLKKPSKRKRRIHPEKKGKLRKTRRKAATRYGNSSRLKLSLGFKRTRKKTKSEPVVPESLVQPQIIQALPVPVPVAEVVQVAPIVRDATSLGIVDLIRPGSKLQSSIEGFLLDLRSENTRRAYAKDLKRFVQYLCQRKFERGPEELSRNVIIGYKDSLKMEGLEDTTVDRHLATLRSFFNWLVEEEIIEKNPAENVRFLKPKRVSTTQAFDDDEVKKILAQPNLHTRIGAQHYAILMVLFFCGLRRTELCELRTRNLSVERGHRVLRLRGKGNAERLIPLIPEVWNAIRYYFLITGKRPGQDQYLFTPLKNNRTGVTDKPFDSSMIYYIVTSLAKKAGIAKRVSPHSCRATAISNARDHNVSDRAIQEFAGWSSTQMIVRYDKRKTAIENSAAHSIDYGIEKKGSLSRAFNDYFKDDPIFGETTSNVEESV